MNKLKQIDDNLFHQEGAQVREERRRKKQSLAFGEYSDKFCRYGQYWDATCEQEYQIRWKSRDVQELEEQINNYFAEKELSKFPKEYLEVYTGPPTPTTTNLGH